MDDTAVFEELSRCVPTGGQRRLVVERFGRRNNDFHGLVLGFQKYELILKPEPKSYGEMPFDMRKRVRDGSGILLRRSAASRERYSVQPGPQGHARIN